MNDMMISADIGDNRMYHRAREAGALAAIGAQKLKQLHALLDRPWFCERHTARFELETIEKDLTLQIVRPGQQVLHQIERRGIQPLQVVKEEGKGMFWPREYAYKSTEYELEPALRLP